MNEIVFATYIIALVALAMALYAILELREIKNRIYKKPNSKTRPIIETKRPKGHWD